MRKAKLKNSSSFRVGDVIELVNSDGLYKIISFASRTIAVVKDVIITEEPINVLVENLRKYK